MTYDIYVGPNANDEGATWKSMQVFVGTTSVYKGAEGTEIAPQSTWTTNELPLDEMSLSHDHLAINAFTIGLGLNTNTGDYYMDNIKLVSTAGGTGISRVKVAKIFVDENTLLMGI